MATSHEESGIELVRRFVAAVNACDWPRLRELVAPSFVRHSAAAGEPGVRTRDDLVRFLEQEFVTFPDARESIEDIFASGDRVAVRHRFEGTQHGALGTYPPSGRRLRAEYLAIYRIEDGRIAEAWAEWDTLASLRQLGHVGPG